VPIPTGALVCASAEKEQCRPRRRRLLEERQLKIEYGPDGQIILRKYDRKLDMTREEIHKLLEEVRSNRPQIIAAAW
jgi:hypothetical protein